MPHQVRDLTPTIRERCNACLQSAPCLLVRPIQYFIHHSCDGSKAHLREVPNAKRSNPTGANEAAIAGKSCHFGSGTLRAEQITKVMPATHHTDNQGARQCTLARTSWRVAVHRAAAAGGRACQRVAMRKAVSRVFPGRDAQRFARLLISNAIAARGAACRHSVLASPKVVKLSVRDPGAMTHARGHCRAQRKTRSQVTRIVTPPPQWCFADIPGSVRPPTQRPKSSATTTSARRFALLWRHLCLILGG